MVDPTKITNFNLTDYELEERILFWILAAGKNGRTAAKCLENLLNHTASLYWGVMWSIYRTNLLYDLSTVMKGCGIGCYNSKARSFVEVATAVINNKINLRTCTAEELEAIYGIGMKTSRCFILHSRYGARYAGLDTHILKYLKENGVKDVPRSTPTSKKLYIKLEKEFLDIADKEKKIPSTLDLDIWNKYSVKVLDK